jgi:hypothetical protein
MNDRAVRQMQPASPKPPPGRSLMLRSLIGTTQSYIANSSPENTTATSTTKSHRSHNVASAMTSRSLLLILTAFSTSASSHGIAWWDVPGELLTQTRRLLSFKGIFSQQYDSKESPYDRVMGHPVFQVTTPWGSAYMNMEKLGVDDIINAEEDLEDIASGKATLGSDSNQYRTISLYYMDPDDALAAHAEFLQMEQMSKTDIRLTSVSLAKALRSAANLGHGLLTGQPIDALRGKVLSTKEGGSLRHKIMPPKKQLYYAARCYGKERVGLFDSRSASSEDAAKRDLAVMAVLGNSALTLRNLQRKQAKRERKIKTAPKTIWEANYDHMDGCLGIPVFYAHGMQRHFPVWKGLISGHRRETPLFFNYEDLERAWKKTRSKQRPAEPVVEVFNLWDVLTSMDKEQDRQRHRNARAPITKRALQAVVEPLQRRWGSLPTNKSHSWLDLDSITFVPSSDACSYKESITARGNGKARLRPMR